MFRRSGHRISLWHIAAAIGLLVSLRAAAQEVILQLRNGDRITGFIQSETNRQVLLTNAWSTNIVVPIDAILKREPVVAAVPTNAPARALSPPIPVPTVRPKSLIWAGEVQLGTDLGFSEKKRQLYTGRAKVTMGFHRLRNLFDYSFSYGQNEGVVSANRMDGTAKTDYDLTSRIYAYNLIGSGYDEIRKINFRYEMGPGLGYHVVKRTNFLFNTEAGINYQAQYLADDSKTELFFFRLAEDAMWKITDRLTLDEKFEYFPQVGDFGQYRLRFEANLRYAFAPNLFFTLTVLDQYDSHPASGIGPNDLQVKSTLGVKF
jgi:putative salt-induced outer membrane protein